MIYLLLGLVLLTYILVRYYLDLKDKILIDNLNTDEVVLDDIDVVITWVDSSDEHWIEMKEYYKKNSFKLCDSSDKRFPNKNFSSTELYFCVSSISKYMPWVRNIFIITCFNQKPSWIDKFPKIKIIDHKDIIPNEYLPTFNTNPIEGHIYKIPNLSDKFIYFNDDMYVTNYVKKNFFFKNNLPLIPGRLKSTFQYIYLPFIFLSIVKLLQSKNTFITKYMDYKYVNLINSIVIIYPSHVCLPLTKNIMNKLENKFKKEYSETGKNKFRSYDDLRITYLAATFTPYLSKYGSDKSIISLISIESLNQVKDQKLISINDVHENSSFKKLIDFFEKKHGIKYFKKHE